MSRQLQADAALTSRLLELAEALELLPFLDGRIYQAYERLIKQEAVVEAARFLVQEDGGGSSKANLGAALAALEQTEETG